MNKAELHAHTTFSDGVLTPAELVAEALRVGLTALAVTDHDIVDGVPVARAAAEGTDLELIPGVEFSTRIFTILPLTSDSISLNSFIASMIHTGWPAEIVSPTLTKGSESGFGDRKNVPIIGDFTST